VEDVVPPGLIVGVRSGVGRLGTGPFEGGPRVLQSGIAERRPADAGRRVRSTPRPNSLGSMPVGPPGGAADGGVGQGADRGSGRVAG
jgi:hypothetical protein